MRLTRRSFLKGAALSAPMLWLRRHAHATEGFRSARHVLVLFAQGGFRSHCTFNAVGEFPRVNPFGVHPDEVPGRQWKLGGAVGSETWGGTSIETIPSFASISADVTVLGCVDHDPANAPDGDHPSAVRRIATGSPMGTTGLLSLVGRDHPMYSEGFSLTAVPPVEIGPSAFGWGSGDYAASMPLSIESASRLLVVGDAPIGKRWSASARAQRDDRFRDTSPRAYRSRIGAFLRGKRNATVFAEMLADPRLAVLDDPEASDAGFTNGQLVEALGHHEFPAPGGMVFDNVSWGADVALALRFFGFGSPIAVVRRNMYDMHEREQEGYAARAADLVRQLAVLHFLLHRMPHAEGGTYWDRTIVVVPSEFGRNNVGADGFNSGRGSDHVEADPGPMRNQSIALMGGPITASKGRLIGPTDSGINALDPAQVFTSAALLSTLVDALGIHRNYFGANPIGELFA